MATSRSKRAQVAQRRTQAIAMRLAGVEWATIADRLGYSSKGAAHTDVTRALRQSTSELAGQVEEMRTLQQLRTDRLLAAVWAKAIKGDLKAVETALKLMERHAKLYGLDAPSRVSVDAERLGSEIGDLLTALTDEDEATGAAGGQAAGVGHHDDGAGD
ncbi:hypothetical protein RM572_00425 [Streptomyces sp. DSM 42041]|uniref:Uncharacterized protein n=1 Tax=Streptomyces hazeniae TaxID=3075538 RepID=A0ABU2NKV8_9ACTN|nr:hypothetical protein [Streptomyces sp. DSM 42041]MDT0377241.1 hypothetical protein [Streptomyces sp. DSM 42041]